MGVAGSGAGDAGDGQDRTSSQVSLEELLALLGDPSSITLSPSCLRMFMSLDMVGSTAYKQRTVDSKGDNNAQPWLRTFTGLFAGIEDAFRLQWKALRTRVHSRATARVGDQPRFWKALGDEVVYCLELTDPLQVILGLGVFLGILNHYQRVFQRSPGLSAKGTAWLAGFPVSNSEIVLGERGDALLDFL